MTKKKNRTTFFKSAKTEEDKNLEPVRKVETKEVERKPEMEQILWSVRAGNQTLYKVFLSGRTRLDNMSAEETKKVKDVMEKAVDDLTKILEKRTTQHAVRKSEESNETEDSPIVNLEL